MDIHVTDNVGSLLSGVVVRAAGPTDRQGSTDAAGSVQFGNLAAGTYRLRFEGEAFITLERDVTIRVGQPARIDVTLSRAPEIVKEVRAPEPAPPPVTPSPPPPIPVEPARLREAVTVSIPAFLDRNFIGREPVKASTLACADAATVQLLQLREPLREHVHTAEDEALYVVAGEGAMRINAQETAIRPGSVSVIPRGTTHDVTRRGRNPLILLSVLSGKSCEGTAGIARSSR